MAKYTLTQIYPFKYRFQCEHCGQTTEWKDACFKGKTETDEEDKDARLKIEKEQKEFFHKKVIPILLEKVNKGKYEEVYEVDKKTDRYVDSRCPNCNKQQTWGKTEGIGAMLFGIVMGAGFSVLALHMYNTGADTGKGKLQIWAIVIGLIGVVAFIFGLLGFIGNIMTIAEKRRETKNVTEKRKPEFNWPKEWFVK